jgi:hypothetical protein
MALKKDLEENAKEYFNNALTAQKNKQCNTAVTLFFKSISALADLIILKKDGKIPSNHAERFRILEKEYKEIYRIIDKNFPFYQDSYRSKLNLEVSKIFENDTRRLFEIAGIKI